MSHKVDHGAVDILEVPMAMQGWRGNRYLLIHQINLQSGWNQVPFILTKGEHNVEGDLCSIRHCQIQATAYHLQRDGTVECFSRTLLSLHSTTGRLGKPTSTPALYL